MTPEEPILNSDQKRSALRSPAFVLRFLAESSQRELVRSANPDLAPFSDSAIFHRLRDLLWCLDEPCVMALLNEQEKSALADFNQACAGLSWQDTEGHSHISELANDDLSPIVPTAARLLQLLDAKSRGARAAE